MAKDDAGRNPAWKSKVFFAVLACFFCQGFFVYSNFGYQGEQVALSPEAQAGLKVWQSHNCQSCHQLYGFGGFIGPDLTNIAKKLDLQGFKEILTVGRKQMPAFQLSPVEISAVQSFFTELDRSGTGYPYLEDQNELAKVESHYSKNGRDRVLSGLALMKNNGCFACHGPVRAKLGPDLAGAYDRRSEAYVRSNLLRGRGTMPAYNFLSREELDLVDETLRTLNEDRRTLQRTTQLRLATVLERLPWFEY